VLWRTVESARDRTVAAGEWLRRTVFSILCCALSFCATGLGQTANPEVTIAVSPDVPLIEHRDHEQRLNFDLAVTNHTHSTWRLTEIELSVFDSADRLVMRKTVNSDGLAPGVEIVAPPLLKPDGTVDVFNPFYALSDEIALHHLRYSFRYLREDNEKERERNPHRLPIDYDLQAEITVIPRDYQPRTNLILPLTGRVFIWEGHDFYAHHRRVPLHAENVRKLGIHANANRYGSDLVIVDEQGRMYHDDPYNKKNWYTYGEPIYAPGEGKVIASANNVPDNEFQGKDISTPQLPSGADPDLGNYVLIDHGNGEFSIFPHMMAGSVRVKAGDSVRQGKIIGQVGFSGDAIFPHVHYSLLAGPDIYRSESLPAYFTQFRRLLGNESVRVEQGTIDSGDILESTAKYVAKP
jgi:murein DD-endopeptidase MepM/ murein hydrolase activator NlpD